MNYKYRLLLKNRWSNMAHPAGLGMLLLLLTESPLLGSLNTWWGERYFDRVIQPILR